MMINFFVMQIQQGWITIEQVPIRYRTKVQELLELSEIGVDESDKEG
ncbi:CD1375 family protein [Streptococcus suis]|nr:CD1375 family protein [Streptococcus suis]